MPKFAVNVTIYVEADDAENAGNAVYEMMLCHPSFDYEERTIYHAAD